MIEELFQKQRDYFFKSAPFSYSDRMGWLESLGKMIGENRKAIADALYKDLKKSELESVLSEINFVVDEIHYAQKNLKSWMKTRCVRSSLLVFPAQSKILAEARGQILVLSPWNYPFQLAISPCVAALAAGNTVILKPSEISAQTTLLLENLVSQYFHPEVFSVVSGDAAIAQKLMSLPFDFCFFTGSTPVGKIVMESCAKNLTPLCLELGGKSPALVDESAHLKLSSRKIVWGKFFNTGQTCVAPDYVWAHEKVYEELLENLKNDIIDFYGVDPKSSKDFGRIISDRHFERLQKLHDPSKVWTTGEWDKVERYIPPSIYRDVSWSDALMQDEIFGPLLPVLKFKTWDEVIAKQQSLPKPLSLYLFAENERVKDLVSQKISFGGGCINDTLMHLSNPRLPFGGVGSSGMGAYHGKFGFDLMSHHKALLEQRSWGDLRSKYPPYKGLRKLFKI